MMMHLNEIAVFRAVTSCDELSACLYILTQDQALMAMETVRDNVLKCGEL